MRGAVAQSLLFVDEVHLVLSSIFGLVTWAGKNDAMYNAVPLRKTKCFRLEIRTVRDLTRKAAQRNSWKAVQKYK